MALFEFTISSVAGGVLKFVKDVPDDVVMRWNGLLSGSDYFAFMANELHDDRFNGTFGRVLVMREPQNLP